MKKFLLSFLALASIGEGIIHFIVSIISLWGIAATGAWDARVMTAPIVDLFLGIISLTTGIVLGKRHHH